MCLLRRGGEGSLSRVDAVGIERRHGITALLLRLVNYGAEPKHRVVDPFWRIELSSDEGKCVEGTRRERRTDVIRALHQPVFMTDARIEQDAMDELRALVAI